MYINASFITYHVTECFQPRSLSCRICHACSTMQILQICLFPVGYDILRQCIITPMKRAHDTFIQNIVSTSYSSTASNSKTFVESSRRNTWLRFNVWSCRSAKKITLADNHASLWNNSRNDLSETATDICKQRQPVLNWIPWIKRARERKGGWEPLKVTPEIDDEDLEYDWSTDKHEELAGGDSRSKFDRRSTFLVGVLEEKSE